MKTLRIRTKSGSFRRAGRLFTETITEIPEGDLTAEQVKTLSAEPMLIVASGEIEDPKPIKGADPKAGEGDEPKAEKPAARRPPKPPRNPTKKPRRNSLPTQAAETGGGAERAPSPAKA